MARKPEMKCFLFNVTVSAQMCVRAPNIVVARALALVARQRGSVVNLVSSEDMEVSQLPFSDPALPEVSLSPIAALVRIQSLHQTIPLTDKEPPKA